MKNIYTIVCFTIVNSTPFYIYGMHHNQMQSKLAHDKEIGTQIIKKIRLASSIGTIIGGWGFFAANSQTLINQLPYRAKRAPLALFLTCCSINQIMLITNVESKPDIIEKIGAFYNKKINIHQKQGLA